MQISGRNVLVLCALWTVAMSNAGGVTVQEQAFARWKIQDKCVADSIKAHPNRDVASQRLRDADVDKCLADHDLPPRAHVAPAEDASNPAGDERTAN